MIQTPGFSDQLAGSRQEDIDSFIKFVTQPIIQVPVAKIKLMARERQR
jgi:hypothetical protein